MPLLIIPSFLRRPCVWLGLCCTLAALLGLGWFRSPWPRLGLPSPEAQAQGSASLALIVSAAVDPTRSVLRPRVRIFHELPDASWSLVRTQDGELGQNIVFQALPSGPAWVLVDLPGCARQASYHVLYESDPTQAPVNVVKLAPAVSLQLQVRAEDGSPIVGATVIAREEQVLPFAALTDTTGNARLELPTATQKVEVFAPGFAPGKTEASGSATIVLARLGSLNVRVLGPDGKGAPGAEIWLVGSALWPLRKVQCDAAGEANLMNVPDGLLDLRAVQGQLVSATLSGIHIRQGQRRSVELALLPGRYVNLNVAATADRTDASGTPLESARVVIAEQGLNSFPFTGVTDARGLLLAGPFAGTRLHISARAMGYVTKTLVLELVEAKQLLALNLLRVATLRGSVVDESGRAVQGADIEITGTDLDGEPVAETPTQVAYREANFESTLTPPQLLKAGDLGVTIGPLPYVNDVARRPDIPRFQINTGQWQTDAKGYFRANPVPPGRLRAAVHHPDFATATSEFVQLAPGGSAEVRVVMSRGATLEARVVDDHGFAITNARVLVTGAGGYERAALSDNYGQVSFHGLPNSFTAFLARPEEPNRPVARFPLECAAGATLERDLVLPVKRDSVDWRVSTDRDDAIELAQVSAVSLDPLVPYRATQFADRYGHVRFDDLLGLKVRVRVDAPGYTSNTELLAAAPAEYRLVLVSAASVTGVVTAVSGRQTVAGARVTLVGPGFREQTLTSSFGEYSFAGVPVGAVEVRVEHRDYAPALMKQTILAPSRGDRATELPPIDLLDGASISGVVQDAEGSPVAGVRLSTDFLPTYQPRGNIDVKVALTDADGRFELLNVAPGTVVIHALAPGQGRASLQLELEPRRDVSDLVLTLAATTATAPTTETGPASEQSAIALSGLAITLGQSAAGQLQVLHVAQASEAERAGLMLGDELLRIDDVEVHDLEAARTRLSGAAGSDVVVEIRRQDVVSQFRVRREELQR